MDSFLRVDKTPMRMGKWLITEQWVDIIISLFDSERREEELDEKALKHILGRDERLKRFMDVKFKCK